MTIKTILLLLTAASTSLAGGLFYAFSVSVMPGLGRLSDQAFLAAMQAINRAILNPVFFASFMGTVLLLPVSTYLSYSSTGLSTRFYLLLAASSIYLVGVFGVTIAGNVPLNEWLDKIDLSSLSASEIASSRERFEGPWNRLHTIRTAASFVAILLVISACLSQPVLKN